MRRLAALGCIMGVALLSGCVSLQVGTETGPNRLEMKGLADGYVAIEPVPEYDGTIFDLGLLQEKYDQWEVASIELWPLLDTGVGVAGARLRLLYLGLGAGTLWYQPVPRKFEPAPAPPQPKAPDAD